MEIALRWDPPCRNNPSITEQLEIGARWESAVKSVKDGRIHGTNRGIRVEVDSIGCTHTVHGLKYGNHSEPCA